MKMELLLKFTFEASHSLAGFETPHPHLWILDLSVAGKPIEGRILDIVTFRARIQKMVDSLTGVYLNDSLKVDAAVREFPTCETLSYFFASQLNKILSEEYLPHNPSVLLTSVTVRICNMDGS